MDLKRLIADAVLLALAERKHVEQLAEVMTADEVADLLGVDKKTIYDKANRGQIPCRRLGRRMLFGRRAILDWLNKPAQSSDDPQRQRPSGRD